MKADNNASLSMTLSSIGGFVDGACFLLLFRLFISHMSGNSTMLGMFLSEENWPQAMLRIFPIGVFIAGAFVASLTAAVFADRKRRGGVSLLLVTEAAFLAVFGLLAAPLTVGTRIETDSMLFYYFMVSLPAFAMGIQNATIRQVGGAGIRTTFVSGTLASVGEELSTMVHWAWKQGRSQGLTFLNRVMLIRQAPNVTKTALLVGIWCTYVFGALSGAWLLKQLGVGVVALPVAVLLALALRLKSSDHVQPAA